MKTGPEFPKLLGVESPDAQLRCGDRLSLCGKSKILSRSGEAYWDRIHNDAKEACRRFVKSSPMERFCGFERSRGSAEVGPNQRGDVDDVDGSPSR